MLNWLDGCFSPHFTLPPEDEQPQYEEDDMTRKTMTTLDNNMDKMTSVTTSTTMMTMPSTSTTEPDMKEFDCGVDRRHSADTGFASASWRDSGNNSSGESSDGSSFFFTTRGFNDRLLRQIHRDSINERKKKKKLRLGDGEDEIDAGSGPVAFC